MRCIDWGLALMVIEITKKHIIAAITCLAVGVAIGVGTVMLVNHESKNMSQTETTSAQVKSVEAPRQETSTPTNQANTNSMDVLTYRNARFGFCTDDGCRVGCSLFPGDNQTSIHMFIYTCQLKARRPQRWSPAG